MRAGVMAARHPLGVKPIGPRSLTTRESARPPGSRTADAEMELGGDGPGGPDWLDQGGRSAGRPCDRPQDRTTGSSDSVSLRKSTGRPRTAWRAGLMASPDPGGTAVTPVTAGLEDFSGREDLYRL